MGQNFSLKILHTSFRSNRHKTINCNNQSIRDCICISNRLNIVLSFLIFFCNLNKCKNNFYKLRLPFQERFEGRAKLGGSQPSI